MLPGVVERAKAWHMRDDEKHSAAELAPDSSADARGAQPRRHRAGQNGANFRPLGINVRV